MREELNLGLFGHAKQQNLLTARFILDLGYLIFPKEKRGSIPHPLDLSFRTNKSSEKGEMQAKQDYRKFKIKQQLSLIKQLCGVFVFVRVLLSRVSLPSPLFVLFLSPTLLEKYSPPTKADGSRRTSLDCEGRRGHGQDIVVFINSNQHDTDRNELLHCFF
jgi:hypothetical protein